MIKNNIYQETFDHLQKNTPSIANTTAKERIHKIRRLYQSVYDLRHEISRSGKDEINMDGKFHLIPLKSETDFICTHLEQWMQKDIVKDVPELQGNQGYIHYEPKGIILHISTWNSPILTALSPIISMIASGNAVVLKPSEITEKSATILCKIVEQAQLTDDIAVVTGNKETAQALLKLPFNHICYIGNNTVGRYVMEAAAQNFASVTLEMGGKNPVIVEADTDIEDTAAKLIFASTIIAGQVCLSPDYVLVHNSVKDKLIEALKNKTDLMFNSNNKGIDKSPDLARIVSKRHSLRIKNLMDSAVQAGASIIYGGKIDTEQHYVEPTLITGMTSDMEIFHEEVFAPILLIDGFDDKETAIAEIAKRPKPLALYVFTQDRATADWYFQNTRAGTSVLNNAIIQANIPTLPFGGCNHSGIGRLGGHAGFLEFSNPRSIVEDSLEQANGREMMYPPFPSEAAMFVDMMLAPSDEKES